jgi:DNA-binding transcriptional LysR family regulator
VDEHDLVTVPALEEELLLVTAASHPLARKRRITPADLKKQSFVLFEAGSNTRRALDDFFIKEEIEPRLVTDTENVEIIKALVRAGLGITIIPYQAIARELASGQFFCSRIHGASLVRRTGWVYARTSRVPRAVQAVLESFDKIKPRLRLAPSPGGPRTPIAAAVKPRDPAAPNTPVADVPRAVDVPPAR